MANTYVPTGSIEVSIQLRNTVSGDQVGQASSSVDYALALAAAASLPETAQISGFLYGEPVAAAGDWLLAHASDPFQSMGDATYSNGLTVAGKKLKALYVRNQDTTNSVTIAEGATNGLPIFGAAGDAFTIQPGGCMCLVLPTGTAALTSGSNDKLTLSVSGGSPQLEVIAVYGT